MLAAVALALLLLQGAYADGYMRGPISINGSLGVYSENGMKNNGTVTPPCSSGQVYVYVDNSHDPKPVVVQFPVLAHINAGGGGFICVKSSDGIIILSDDKYFNQVCWVAPNTLKMNDRVSTDVVWGGPCPVAAQPGCLPKSCDRDPCPGDHPVSTQHHYGTGCCALWLGGCQTCCTH